MARRAQGLKASEHFSMRMKAPLSAGLERRADETRESKTALVERYVDEGLKRDAHPEITFRDGPFGRRAMLGNTRLDVWQIIETLRNSGNSLEEAADYLNLPVSRMRACLSFYAAYQAEVDEYAKQVAEANLAAETAWRREQALIGV